MQGWDSVALEADVELGGTDQLFNLIRGRDFQREEGQEPQIVSTMPLIEGLDGRKMSKSYGNTIGLTDAPDEVFGKTMSLADDKMALWFELLTRLDSEEIDALLRGHPRTAKARLGQELVAFLHGPEAAAQARAEFDRRFVDKEKPDDIPDKTYGDWPVAGVPLAVLLREVGLVGSSSEARRLITQGGVRTNDEVVKDPKFLILPPEDSLLVQVGKRRFARVRKG
jgi:tyrosyl-tRNA synthetase